MFAASHWRKLKTRKKTPISNNRSLVPVWIRTVIGKCFLRPEKSRISLWKLIAFDYKNQFQQNKQFKLKLSNKDTTQFVWV